MKKAKSLILATALLACVGSASSLAGNDRGPVAQQELQRAFPGVRVFEDAGRTRILYGKSMTTAPAPRMAAERWLKDHGETFGVGQLELVEEFAGDVRDGEFYVFMYSQTLGGVPVELSPGRVLVHNNGDGTWSVVYAAGLFVATPEGGFAAMTRTAQDAVNFVKGTDQYGGLPMWSGAELVIYQRQVEEGFEGVRAWKFVGENPDMIEREKYTFFVDAATGGLLEARNEVLNIDVFGYANGFATPGTLPDISGNAPVLFPINDLDVRISGGNSDYTDTDGFFNITHSGSSDVTISANFDTGLWANVNDLSGTAVLSESTVATPGVEAMLEFNSTPSQFETAQVNGFIHTGLSHNMYTDRSSWTGMDFRCTVNVNINSTCNAFFDGNSINMFRAGGGCVNTSYSTVIAHEYGHYVVSRLGLAQGAFGEGYSDCLAQMLYDTGIVGENFFTNGGHIRDNENTLRQYPCSLGIHACGQVIGGVWRHTRLNFGLTYGSSAGLAVAQQAFVDWSLITTGGSGNNSAHPGTAIEVLTIDDDDGNLDNGTPNFADICAAFSLHGIDCPDIQPIIFAYPNGLPELLTPGQPMDIDVTISANGADPDPSTAQIVYLIDGGGLTVSDLTYHGGDDYTATIGAVDCASIVDYFFQIDDTGGTTFSDPGTGTYTVQSFDSLAVLTDEDFETNGGFTVGDTGDTATTGVWNRMDPQPTAAQPGDDISDDGAQCWVTDGFAGGSIGANDVDNGKTTLKSAIMDLSDSNDPIISYWRWYSNDEGADPNNDTFRVDINDGGGWTNAETVGPAGVGTSGGWFYHEFRVADFVNLNSTVQVRFVADDASSGSIIEAAVDEFMVTDGLCNDCVADFNGDGDVNTQDVLAFLNAWNAGDMSADINGDGEVNTQDVLAFLNLWNAGC